MKRIFSVRVNVDEIAASVGVLFTEQEKALWLQGFVYALQGGASRVGMHQAFDGGFLIGRMPWEAARNHQEVSSKGGKISIERHPENSVNRHPPSEAPSEAPSEGSREQSLIVNRVISNRQSEINNPEKEEPPSASRSKRFVPPTVADVEAYALAAGHSIDAVKFVAYWEAADWMRGKTKISNWKMAVVTWTRNNFDKAKAAPVASQDEMAWDACPDIEFALKVQAEVRAAQAAKALSK